MIENRLFDILTNKLFQNPETGNLFFPTYIYTYDPEEEYRTRKELEDLKERLKRPDHYIDLLSINIYHEFIDYLKLEKFGDEETLLNLLFQKEEEEGWEEILEILKEKAFDSEFLKRIDEKVTAHFEAPGSFKKVYVLIHGFGSMFPIIRVSRFLNNFERYIKGYKLIVLYPGENKNNNYCLFKRFQDEHLYRAVLLN